jgi:hypothetical protein
MHQQQAVMQLSPWQVGTAQGAQPADVQKHKKPVLRRKGGTHSMHVRYSLAES